MKRCGCNSGMGQIQLPSESVTVTAPRHSCLDILPVTGTGPNATWATPTILQRIEYALCVGATKMEDAALSAWHWLWNELDALWNDLWGITKSVGGTIVQWGRQAGKAIKNGAAALWNRTKQFFGWVENAVKGLSGKIGQVGTWLLIAGGIFLAVELSPAINDVASNVRRRHK